MPYYNITQTQPLFGGFMRTTLLLIFFLLIVVGAMMMKAPSTTASTPLVKSTHALPAALSHGVTRLNQLDCRQYSSQDECSTWSYSACSAAVMAEVLNAYGHHYRITDILRVEAALKRPTVITPDQGLLYSGGIERTIHVFGFWTTWLKHPTVAQLVAVAAQAPVIVNFPPSRWTGGHFLIVTGGNVSHVFLVDSSRLNLRSMTIATFLTYWVGFAIVVSPKGGR
ncbi:MAG: hypothetical protein H0U76_03895 [Ktedonobacteraceae bacterium]|nr:hypothetical protein [Ktedonobacteraceae bacterium]